MTIWALKDPTGYPEFKSFALESIDKGESRFGWGWRDLKELAGKPKNELTDLDNDAFSRARFLLLVKEGDWMVHINQPEYGQCIAVRATGEYKFIKTGVNGDFGNCIPIDVSTKVVFNRNDRRVHPRVSRSLKPRRHYQRVHYVNEFLESLEQLKIAPGTTDTEQSKGTLYFKKELETNQSQ